jgi:hypothetical protein
MALVFRALHAAPSRDLLNEEWMLVENTGQGVLNSSGWSITVGNASGQRPRVLGQLAPGFLMQPGDKVRLVTGTPGKKSLGAPPPEDAAAGIKNYFLFLREPILTRAGLVVRVTLNQMELARAGFAPSEVDGIAKAS